MQSFRQVCRGFAHIYDHTTGERLVRYPRKKPPFVPKSKSKIFYVRKPTPKDPDETAELLVRFRHYKTTLKSLHAFLRTWQEKVDHKVEDVEHNAELEAAEHARLLAINDEWNRNIAIGREARLEAEEKERQKEVGEKKNVIEMERLMGDEEARYRVIEESSLPFITREDLDEEIEKVMASHSDYNFSIDTQGNIYESKKRDS